MEGDEGRWSGKQGLVVGQGRTSLFSCSVSDISFGRLLWEGFEKNDLLTIVRRRTRMPLISAAFFVHVCCGGLGPAVTLLDISSQAFLSSSEKLCSCWKVVGKNLSNSWFCLWKHLLALFLCCPTTKVRFPAAIHFGFKCWNRVAWGLYKQSA